MAGAWASIVGRCRPVNRRSPGGQPCRGIAPPPGDEGAPGKAKGRVIPRPFAAMSRIAPGRARAQSDRNHCCANARIGPEKMPSVSVARTIASTPTPKKRAGTRAGAVLDAPKYIAATTRR